MVNALSEGDWERGRELHYELLPLFRALFVETNPIPVKTAASHPRPLLGRDAAAR